jgi:hypothetical protein
MATMFIKPPNNIVVCVILLLVIDHIQMNMLLN